MVTILHHFLKFVNLLIQCMLRDGGFFNVLKSEGAKSDLSRWYSKIGIALEGGYGGGAAVEGSRTCNWYWSFTTASTILVMVTRWLRSSPQVMRTSIV